MLTNIKNFALIIGAMKCGTTSLFYYLSQHPEICSCREKEPEFFTNDAKWYQGFNWYQSYELKKVCEFLNVDASYKFHNLGQVKNATNEQVIENKFLRLVKNNKKIHNLILSAVPLKLRKMVTNPMKKKIKSYFKLSPEQRKFVFNELKEDLIRLKTKYKFDLSKWGIDIAKNEF